ncbi:hypothetical protein C8R45DRAFT_281447 [Mycena sanguinolenta]|nr:hypothetical protein C8R45DRAFT_281447 [Mycena sanguinolenta]
MLGHSRSQGRALSAQDRAAGPLHEFLVVSYQVVTKPGVANYLIIERWGSDQRPEDPAQDKVDNLDIDTNVDLEGCDIEIQPNIPVIPLKSASSAVPEISRAAGRKSSKLGKPLDWIGNDRIAVSCRRSHFDIEKVENGKRTLLATLVPRPEHAISVAQMLCVAFFVSNHSPNYDSFDQSCYYFSRAVFNLSRSLMKCQTTDIKWGTTLFKGAMAEGVKADFSPAALLDNCVKSWMKFEEEVSNSEQMIKRPLQEEIRKRECAERRLQEIKEANSDWQEAVEEANSRRDEAQRRLEEAERRLEEAEARLKEVEARFEA